MLAVREVELSLGDVNHLRLLNRQRADAAGSFHRQLVLHRENMDHHRLDPRGTGVSVTGCCYSTSVSHSFKLFKLTDILHIIHNA